MTKAAGQIQWHDVREWGVEGKGWDTTQRFFDRLPRHAKSMVTESVWEMSRAATGMSVSFGTDAKAVHARWVLRSPALGEANFARAAYSGLDLYARDRKQWRWVGWAGKFANQRPNVSLAADLPGTMRDFRIYLPLRNPIASLEVGVPRGSHFEGIAPRAAKPIVYYGTSIVHGAFASRAGMAHPSILGRLLDRPVVNLGFSGQARMDEGMAKLLGELDAACFVIDPLPNMDAALVDANAPDFLRIIRGARPGVRIVMVEDAPLSNAWINPAALQRHQLKWRSYRKAWRAAQDEGGAEIAYVAGATLLGDDGTVDGIHPNDLGHMRTTRRLLPVLRSALNPRYT